MRKKRWKRMISILMAGMMVLTAVPVTAQATEGTAETATTVELVNIAGEATVSSQDNSTLWGNSITRINDGVIETDSSQPSAALYGDSIEAYKKNESSKYTEENNPKKLPWIQMDFPEAKHRIRKISVISHIDNGDNGYDLKCKVYAKSSSSEAAYTSLGQEHIIERSANLQDCRWDLDLGQEYTIQSLLVTVDRANNDCWPVLDEIEIYQEQELVNIAGEATVSSQDNSTLWGNSITRINDGVIETDSSQPSAALYGDSIETYKTNEGGKYDEGDPKKLPWIQMDFPEAKHRIRKISVISHIDNGDNGYDLKCKVYAKSSSSEAAYTSLGQEHIIERSANLQDCRWDLDLGQEYTIQSLLVTVDRANNDCWPVLDEIEIYQVKTDTPEPETNLQNIAAECTVNATSTSDKPVDKLTDGNDNTLWGSASESWGEPVEIVLPAANTKCVKKVVVKLEKNKPNWSMQIGLSYALNNVTSDKIAVSGSEKQVNFTDGYEYVFETPQAMSHLYITLSNPKDGSAPGQFWPAMAEVEIYVDKDAEEVVELENIAVTGRTKITLEDSVNSSQEKENVADNDDSTSAALHTKNFNEIETDSGTLPFAEVQLNADQKIRQFKLAMKEDTSGAEYGYTLYGKKKYGDAFETIASGTIGTAAENRNAEISVVDLEAFHAKEVEYETLKVIFTAKNEQAKTTIPHLAEFQILANKAAIAVPDTENIAWQTRDLHSNYNQDTVDRIVDGNKGNTWTATQYPAYVDIGLGGVLSAF